MSSLLPSPGSRPSVPRSLGNHEARIRALERNNRSSCYALIDEIVLASNGDPMEFTDIPQTYRHLVLEVSAAITGSFPPRDLRFRWNGQGNWYTSQIDTDGTTLTTQYIDDMRAQGILVPVALGTATNFTHFTAKFPYYATDDRIHGVTWQAQYFPLVSGYNASVGSGASMYDEDVGDNDPIESILIESFVSGTLIAGSRASLYGEC